MMNHPHRRICSLLLSLVLLLSAFTTPGVPWLFFAHMADADAETEERAVKSHSAVLAAADPDEIIKAVVELDASEISVQSVGGQARRKAGNRHQTIRNEITKIIHEDADEGGSRESLFGGLRLLGNQENGSSADASVNAAETADPGYTLLYDYYHVMDGFAIEIPRKYLADVQKINGVRTVFEARTVYPLEETASTKDDGMGASLKNADTLKAMGAENAAYTGKGQVIAILDTGLYTNHEAFKGEIADPALKQEDIADLISQTTLRDKGVTARSLYISSKIPFVYDYTDQDTNVNPGSIADISHGTHVAGIAGANAGDVIRGAAPDAQLFIMKTFSDSGAGDDTNILAAADDAVILGADVINMSLGSDAGFDSNRAEVYTRVYNKIREKGIFLSAAAGNSYSATYNASSASDYAAVTNPDYGILVDPSTYMAAMSVASSDSASEEFYFIASDHSKIVYEEADGGARPRFNTLTGTHPYIDCGYGTGKDVQAAIIKLGNETLDGYIAVIRRGKSEDADESEESLTFSEKISNAVSEGADGVVICDNVDKNTLTVMGGVTETKAPAVFISKADGDKLLAAEKKTIVTDPDYKQGASAKMSSFSSWGVTPEMKLKPEISAPGSNIYSSIPDNKYGYKSGTSMATPGIAGLAADAREYIGKDKKFSAFSEKEKSDLAVTLMMNTALPMRYGDDSWYSPRKQGAGVANLNTLTSAKAYVTVDGSESGKPKAELGDGKGPYHISLTVHNLTNQELKYDVSTAALSEVIKKGYFQQYSKDYAGDGINIAYQGIQNGVLTVPASDAATMQVTITPDTKFIKDTQSAVNGTFIDGYVFFKAAPDSGADLSIPYIAFYGGWGDAPVIDGELYTGKDNTVYMRGCEAYSPSSNNYCLGDNNFNGDIDLDERHYAFSKNSKGGAFTGISTITGLLRPASEMHYVMKYKATGETVNRFDYYNVRRSFYDPAAGMVTYAEVFLDDQGGNPVFGSTTQNNKELTDGVYTIEVSATSCGPSAKTYQWGFDVTYDTKKPSLDGSEITGSGKNKTLTVHISDNHYISALRVVYGKDDTPLETRTFDFDGYEKDGRMCYDVQFNYEDIVEKIKSRTGAEPDKMKVLIYDYAMNETSDTVVLKEVYPTRIALSDAALTLEEGREANLTVNFSPDNVTKKKITWTSSNKKVAAVDANGLVTAAGEGTAVITAKSETDGVKATCQVTVKGLDNKKGIIINRSALVIVMGEKTALNAKLSPALVGSDVKWSSADENIAKVSAKGTVSAVSTGKTKITASVSKNGSKYSDTCTVTVRPAASDEFEIDENGILTDYTGWSQQINIPDGVTGIAQGALKNKQITSVVIPTSTQYIADAAFAGCTGLSSVSFADLNASKCKTIGASAFDGCISLRSMSLPIGLERIGAAAFRGTDLRTLYLPAGITQVPADLCSHCENLTGIEFAGKVTSIGTRAFYNAGLKNTLKLPSSVMSIGESAFENTNITRFTAPESLHDIGSRAFYNTKLSYSYVVLNEGLSEIGSEAFAKTQLRSFAFPDSVTKVGNNVLSDCKSLKMVHIGSGISEIQEPAVRTPALEEFTVSSDNTKLEAIDQALYTKPVRGKRTLIAYSAAGILESSVEIPSDVSVIASNAFREMTNISNLTFKEPSSLEVIERDAFRDAARLTAVKLPDSLKVIEDGAFKDCSQVSELTIGAGLTKLGANAITGMNHLKVIEVSPQNTAYTSRDSVLYDKSMKQLIRYASAGEGREFTAPDNLVYVCDRAFYGATALTAVTFSDGLKSVGEEAFSGCSSLAKISFPDSLESIGARALYGTKPEVLYLGDHLNSMGNESIGNLTSAHIVIDGADVSVPYLPAISGVETIYFGDGVKSIDDQIGISAAERLIFGSNLENVNKNTFNLLQKGTFYIEKDTATWRTMAPIIKELQRRRGSANIKLEEYEPLALRLGRKNDVITANVSGGTGDVEYRFLMKDNGKWRPLTDWTEKNTYDTSPMTQKSLIRCQLRDASHHIVSAQINLVIQSIRGDANGDGRVDAKDLTALLCYLRKLDVITDQKLLSNMDYDLDGDVDHDDLTALAGTISKAAMG